MAHYLPFPLILGATIGLAIALLPHLGPPAADAGHL
jgi:hypothetical protein